VCESSYSSGQSTNDQIPPPSLSSSARQVALIFLSHQTSRTSRASKFPGAVSSPPLRGQWPNRDLRLPFAESGLESAVLRRRDLGSPCHAAPFQSVQGIPEPLRFPAS